MNVLQDGRAQQVLSQTLIHAIQNGDQIRVAGLLAAGADPNYIRFDGETPITVASQRGYKSMIKELIAYKCDVNLSARHPRENFTDSALHIAAAKNDVPIILLLLHHGANVDQLGGGCRTPLMKAAFQGHLNAMKVLIEGSASLHVRDYQHRTALHWSIIGGHIAATRLLLDHGADQNLQDWNGETPLVSACCEGHHSLVKLLLDHPFQQCDVNLTTSVNKTFEVMSGYTALHVASRDGHVAIVTDLLPAGADVDVLDGTGRTPLMWAAKEGRKDIVFLLLQSFSKMNLANFKGQTALFEAIQNRHIEVTDMLLAAGANPDIVTDAGSTALLKAISTEVATLVRLVIQSNCKVNFPNATNACPFKMAAITGHVNIIKMLIIAGADVTIINRWQMFGSLPSTLALQPKLVEWLSGIANNPASLLQICKLRIRKLLGRGLPRKLDRLKLPDCMKDMVYLRELDELCE